jgi:transposase
VVAVHSGMDTRYAETGSDDHQPVLVEVPGPVGIPIGKRLWLVDGDGQWAVFLGATAICVFDADDRDAERVCIATLSKAGLAFDVEIAEAFGVHRNTVARLARQLDEQGMAGVVAAKRGPKGPHKVTDEVKAVIDGGVAAGLGPAEVTRAIVGATGVELSAEHVRQLMAARRPHPADQLTLVGDEPERDEGDEIDQAGHDIIASDDNEGEDDDEDENDDEDDEEG